MSVRKQVNISPRLRTRKQHGLNIVDLNIYEAYHDDAYKSPWCTISFSHIINFNQLVFFDFVDDIDLLVIEECHSTGEEIARSFQETLDPWIYGLSVTGGELAPPKSLCYLLDFLWTGSKRKYSPIIDMSPVFTLINKMAIETYLYVLWYQRAGNC